MISVPGYLDDEGLTRLASIVVKLLVAFTKIRPCTCNSRLCCWTVVLCRYEQTVDASNVPHCATAEAQILSDQRARVHRK